MLSDYRLLKIGLAVFILAKLYLVVVPVTAIAIPRLGDDAMSYLWKGELNSIGYDAPYPAISDLRAQTRLTAGLPLVVESMRKRVAAFIAGTYTPVYDVLARAALSLGLNLKWAFALTEVVGVLAMAVGMSLFMAALVGPGAAGIGLLLLSFAVLPNQGIYAFIPSTMALSLSLVLWAYILRSGRDARPILVLLAGLIILGIHPVAKVYMLLVIPIHIMTLADLRECVKPRSLLVYASVLLALGVWAVLPHLFPALAPIAFGARGGISAAQGVFANLERAGSLMLDPVTRKNLLLVGLFLASIWVGLKSKIAPTQKRMLALLVGLLAGSMLFYLPGYPAELFSRVLVPFAVLAAALSGQFIKPYIQGRQQGKLLRRIFAGGLVLTALVWIGSYVFQTMNWRTEVVHDDQLREQLGRLPGGATVIYGDMEVSLLSSLLLGGYRYGAILQPILSETAALPALINERRPPVVLLPSYPALNSLAQRHAKNFRRRRLGLFAGAVDRFSITGVDTRLEAKSLQLLVRNHGPATVMLLDVVPVADGRSGRRTVNVPAGFSGWLTIDSIMAAHFPNITVAMPDTNLWIEGIAIGKPVRHVRWPWSEGVRLSYHLRGKPPTKTRAVEFSVQALLSQWHAEDLLRYVDLRSPVISDDSGLIFLRTRYYATTARMRSD